MCVKSAAWDDAQSGRNMLASLGLIVISVEFRNSGGLLGPHPFPAGLNDCSSAMEWCHAHKETLGYSKFILVGESGGSNLALATALKAKKEGKLEQVQGVFALCPWVHGDYDTPDPMMASWIENDGYGVSMDAAWIYTTLYDPLGENKFNPLAWPLRAEEEDLQGLPPMVISVYELDPFRDEGIAFFRKAMKAGVQATSITRNGMTHTTQTPEVSQWTLRDIKSFADMI